MNIGQGHFQILSPEQNNPVMAGLQRGLMSAQQFQENKKRQKLMPFVTPNAQAELLSKNLGNQKLQDLLPFVTPEAMADLQSKLMNNAWINPKNASAINLQNAQAGYYNMGGPGMGVDQKNIIGIRRQLAQEHPDWSQSQILDAASQYLLGKGTFSDGTPLPQPSGTVQSMVDSQYMHTVPGQQRDQRNFANTLETTFKNADSVMPSVAKYAGPQGQLKLALDATKAMFGQSSPQYEDYLKFKNQIMPGLTSEIIRTGGAHSSDSQKALAIAQAMPKMLASNPQIAMQQWKTLKDLYGDVGKSVAERPTQITAALRTGTAGVANPSVKPSASAQPLKVGDVYDGMRYVGGNPKDKNNWRPA